jgi:CDP-paratose 2-epimerase
MNLNNILITGSCGLIGSEAVKFFSRLGVKIHGIDNNSRALYFGPKASITDVLSSFNKLNQYYHNNIDIKNKNELKKIISRVKPDAIIHCAGQPSHDKSAEMPFEDFEINALGTMNILDCAKELCPESPFVYTSTNKVYGDNPNRISLIELESRFDFKDSKYKDGIDETMSIDQCRHSPFGASKTSADLMVQEYGLYFGMPTVCFRCGCITGSAQKGVELHGFLNYLCNVANHKNTYKIYGYNGKQVRDNLHASDLILAVYEFIKNPKPGQVYNIGGGKENSCSIIEAIYKIKNLIGFEVQTTELSPRKGDHICYYTNNSKFKSDYPNWDVTKKIDEIIQEML